MGNVKIKGGKLRKKAKWRPLTQRLYDKAWDLMSEYVRRRDKSCYTCGATGDWRSDHCGHFVHGRKDLLPKWYRRQCVSCNKWNHGRLNIYATKLIAEYGLEEVKEYQKYKEPMKWEVNELKEVIVLLEKELKLL